MLVLSERLRNNIGVMAAKTAVVALEAVTVRTPVDTSEARSNWQLSPLKRTVVRSPIANGRHLGIGERAVYQAVVSAGKTAARSISKDHVCAGRSIWVTNPVPYIGLLNAGWSDQNREGNFDVIAAQLANGFVAGYVRSGKLLTNVDSL